MKLFNKVTVVALGAFVCSIMTSLSVFASPETFDGTTYKEELFNENEVPSALYTAALCDAEPVKNSDFDVYVTVSGPKGMAEVKADSDESSRTIKKLVNGYSLTVLGAEHGWVNVIDDAGGVGYIRGSYVTFHNGKKPSNDDLKNVVRDTKAQAVIDYAKQFLGTPYVWGGTSLTSGVDCSGFVMSVYKNFGVDLYRTTFDMYNQGTPVNKEDLIPGDLVFFQTYAAGPSHVGIYVGDNSFIEAADDGVSITSLDREYQAAHYYGARRILN